MPPLISQEELQELKKIPGEIRGVSMKNHSRFILKEQGEGSLERIEEEMEKLGYPFKYKGVKVMGFYPLNFYCILLLAIKRIFNYQDDKFCEIGDFNSRMSLIIKLFMKNFVSIKRMAEVTPKVWRKYFTVGEIELTDYDEEKKYISLRLTEFHTTPLLCQVVRGFFRGVAKMVVGARGKCREVKCSLKGEPYDEFLFEWE